MVLIGHVNQHVSPESQALGSIKHQFVADIFHCARDGVRKDVFYIEAALFIIPWIQRAQAERRLGHAHPSSALPQVLVKYWL